MSKMSVPTYEDLLREQQQVEAELATLAQASLDALAEDALSAVDELDSAWRRLRDRLADLMGSVRWAEVMAE